MTKPEAEDLVKVLQEAAGSLHALSRSGLMSREQTRALGDVVTLLTRMERTITRFAEESEARGRVLAQSLAEIVK
jgi:hypothetical protein